MSTAIYELPGAAVEQELDTGRRKAVGNGHVSEVVKRGDDVVKEGVD
jgi:hypothetical protein